MDARPIHLGGDPPAHFRQSGLGKSLHQYFGIEINQRELGEQVLARAGGIAAQCTLSDLHAVIWEYVRDGRIRGSAPSQALGFRLVAEAIANVARIDFPRARPSARLADLLPLRGRRAMWEQLRKRLDCGEYQLPPLRLPETIERTIGVCIAFLYGGLILLLVLMNTPMLSRLIGSIMPYWWNGGLSLSGIIFILVLGFPFLGRIISLAIAPLRLCFPTEAATVRKLVLSMWPSRREQWRTPVEWTESRTWRALCQIMRDLDDAPVRLARSTRIIIDPPYRPRCDFCGYDLRSSLGRCPECGLPTRCQSIPDSVRRNLKPRLTLVAASRFLRYQIRKVVCGPLIAVGVGACLIEAHWCLPVGWAVTGIACWLAIRRLFNWRAFRNESAEWQRMPCPQCRSPMIHHSIQRGSRIRYSLSCATCGIRYDVRPPIQKAKKKAAAKSDRRIIRAPVQAGDSNDPAHRREDAQITRCF